MVIEPYKTTKLILAVAGDLIAALLVYILCFYIRSYIPFPFAMGIMPFSRFQHLPHYWMAILLSQLTFLYILGFYDHLWNQPPRESILPLFLGVGVQVLFLGMFYGFFSHTIFPRTIFPIFWVLNTFFLALWRTLLWRLFPVRSIRHLIIIGCNEASEKLVRLIEKHKTLGLRIIGLVKTPNDPGPDSPTNGVRQNGSEKYAGYPVLGPSSELPRILQQNRAEEVVLSTGRSWQEEIMDSLTITERRNIRWSLLPNMYEILIGKPKHLKIQDIPLIEIADDPNPPSRMIIKRALDLFFSFILLVMLGPLFGILMVILLITSGRPIFYLQDRVGKNNRIFRMVKFRTMLHDAEKHTGAILSEQDDPRITPIGRWLRKTRLDELPQLFNVLGGEMSFIGPRPERSVFVQEFQRTVSGYGERMRIKPGITGLAQVNGYYDTDAYNKLKYDLYYIHNYSLWLDFLILVDTVKIIFAGKGM